MATTITQHYIIDMSSNNNFIQVPAVQGDGNTRRIELELISNGSRYIVDESEYDITIVGTKPDGTEVWNRCSTSSGYIIVELTYQMLAVPGRVDFQLMLISKTRNNALKSFPFYVIVTGATFDPGTMISTNEFEALISYTSAAQAAAESIVGTKEECLQYAQEAESWSKGTKNGTQVGPSDPAYANNAKYYSDVSKTYSTDSEAWAKGTRNGSAVPSSDAAYNKHSKYYSQQADTYAQTAESWAKGTKGGSAVPSSDSTYHNNSKYYSDLAKTYAESAEVWSAHPPYIGPNGNWFVYNTVTEEFVDSGIDASITVQIADVTTIPYGEAPYVTNTGSNTDPVFHLFVPMASGIKSIQKTSTDGQTDTYTITFDNNQTATFQVRNGNDSEAWAKGTREGNPVPSTDESYHNNSKYYSEQSSDSSDRSKSWAVGPSGAGDDGTDTNNAKYWAEQSEASNDQSSEYSQISESWAKGTKNGTAVGSTDPAYRNHSKYYSEQSASSASASLTSANKSSTSAKESESWAKGTKDGVAVPSTDQAYHNNAKYYSEYSDTRATDSANSATASETSNLSSEAWARGTKNGSAVSSSDPTYHNNSKYYSELADTSATNAAASETNSLNSSIDSEAWATGARNGVDVDSSDPTYENNAKYYSDSSGQSATDARNWAVGTTGTGSGTDTNNSKYYSELSELSKEGSVSASLDSEAWARGTRNGIPVANDDATYVNNSKFYAQESLASAADSADSALDSEGYSKLAESWARGTRNGSGVPSSDATYHNNAKYYSDLAKTSEITTAQTIAEAQDIKGDAAASAAASAQSASASAASANTSYNHASNSAASAVEAMGYRDETEIIKNTMITTATQAQNYMNSALGYANNAETYMNNASDFTDNAHSYMEFANSYMNSAKNYARIAAESEANALLYENNAETSATNAATSATNAGNSASAAADSALEASGYAGDASDSADAADTSATNAANSAQDAEDIKTDLLAVLQNYSCTNFIICSSLPATGTANTLYLLYSTTPSVEYTPYIYADGQWIPVNARSSDMKWAEF